MTLSDRIALQTAANGSKLVRIPAAELLELMRRAEAADGYQLKAQAWDRLCAAQKDRRELDALARAIKANDSRKDRV